MSNSVVKLSERLQQQMQADQQAVTTQTKKLLALHEQGLKKLSDAALRTTQAAIERQSQALDELHSATLRRLRWLMLWPLVASLALSVAIVAGSMLWSRSKLDQAQQIVSQAQAQAQAQRDQMQQALNQFCQTPVGKRICSKG